MEPYSEREIAIMQLQLWGEIKKRRNHEHFDFEEVVGDYGFPAIGDGLGEREDSDA